MTAASSQLKFKIEIFLIFRLKSGEAREVSLAGAMMRVRASHADSGKSSDDSFSSEEEIEHNKKNQNDLFKIAIESLVSDIEKRPNGKYLLSTIREKYDFQRRRLYDVIRVFETIGCCMKISVDTIMWLGLKNIYPTLMQLATSKHVFDRDFSLENVLKNDSTISISQLTQIFLLSYYALNEKCLDIRAIASFISKSNGRYKSTLCKLYQITYILESIGVIYRKPDVVGFLTLNDQYFVNNDKQYINDLKRRTVSFLDIRSLLNRPVSGNESNEDDYIINRRNQFHGCTITQKSAFLNLLDQITFKPPPNPILVQ